MTDVEIRELYGVRPGTLYSYMYRASETFRMFYIYHLSFYEGPWSREKHFRLARRRDKR